MSLKTIVDPSGDILLELRDEHKRVSQKLPTATASDLLSPPPSSPSSPAAEDEPPTFLVSSAVLMLASAVFKKMLGPDFKEGTEFRASRARKEAYRLAVHEDDREAMALLLDILHFRLDNVEGRSPSPVTLEQLAFVCDKYQCVGAVRAQGFIWLQDVVARGEHMSLHSLARAFVFAYVAELRQPVAEIGWQIMMRHKGPIECTSQLGMLIEHPLFCDDVMDFLAERRDKCGRIFHAGVIKPFSESWGLGDWTLSCAGIDKTVAKYLRKLRLEGIDSFDPKFPGSDFRTLLKAANDFNTIPHDPDLCARVHPCPNAEREMGSDLKDEAIRIWTWRNHLVCLGCLKGKKKSKFCGEACSAVYV